jgi:hypothetical protein
MSGVNIVDVSNHDKNKKRQKKIFWLGFFVHQIWEKN